MKIREFAKAVIKITPPIHAAIVRGQPGVLKKGKITLPQMIVIDILYAKKDCKMSDLSKMLRITKSAVTGITDRLMLAGFLKRARLRTDRRVVKVHLTPKGTNIAKRLQNYKLRTISSLFSDISQRERMQYLHILRKVQKNINGK